MTALLPPGVKVDLALGYIDMRKGLDGLAMLVQGVLQQDPFTGHMFVFRGPHHRPGAACARQHAARSMAPRSPAAV